MQGVERRIKHCPLCSLFMYFFITKTHERLSKNHIVGWGSFINYLKNCVMISRASITILSTNNLPIRKTYVLCHGCDALSEIVKGPT